MPLPNNFIKAVYRDPDVADYKGNPLIEALPPIMSLKQVRQGLVGKISLDPKVIFSDGRRRAHEIAGLLDDFFQPISNHVRLEEKISIMIRRGYVGRNPAVGSMNSHLQDGYERIMSGDLDSFRFGQAKSTARSLSLIGVSGCGKSTTLNRILATYPQVIYHDKHNLTQLSYLKIECPYDGSLKSLCINFFREIDRHLHRDFENKYTRKRLTPEVLLAQMSQLANQYAIGVLVIDEIQRLSRKRSGGQERMLEFFVQLVNVIGIPVILVGTPKARPIFELELQSGRRSAGFGSVFWEPMKNAVGEIDQKTGKKKKTEWCAFAEKLWKYQCLQRREENLPDDIRECWYDLSQGVQDIVVKLFVLAQLRAIATGQERITVGLMKQVYKDELKPVHPMLAALRSGDPELVVKYSDLHVPDIDKQILELREIIEERQQKEAESQESFSGNEQAKRLHTLLVGMDCDPQLVVPLIHRAFKDHSDFSVRELVPHILDWYVDPKNKVRSSGKDSTLKPVRVKDWYKLDGDDLRFKTSQSAETDLYEQMKRSGSVFNMEDWYKNVN
ncbi:MAG: AAA family ATPase [Candidatus Thiodiazotropha sp. (ex Lucinoma borealis)]|nr:AAA family ATPase [Candidatus Thiodiazotropha sp. (ex Lucinoma borealis)]MCU7863321.1 AAA family ATPase [Candidatus Thiodiazotropha sp. (ex Lucinoma borealis)]